MQIINAVSLTENVKSWLTDSHHPRVLHVFDEVCNLTNERREVLSVVTSNIGNGPFNLITEDDFCFFDHINLDSPVSVSPTQLTLDNLTIQTSDAKLWNPCPDWEILHAKRGNFIRQVQGIAYPSGTMSPQRASSLLAMTDVNINQLPNSLASDLSSALSYADISTAKSLASKLAGLGQGLTPAGDDFIMGALYAIWIIHPIEVAEVIAIGVSNTAAPLTMSLSAAWLRSAGRGEAGQVWHDFFDALIAGTESKIRICIENILTVGETSGADALTGFLETIQSYIASLSRNEATSSLE